MQDTDRTIHAGDTRAAKTVPITPVDDVVQSLFTASDLQAMVRLSAIHVYFTHYLCPKTPPHCVVLSCSPTFVLILGIRSTASDLGDVVAS